MATYVIWHAYLLGGSGSSIYTANVAPIWSRQGHRVILMCQDPHPELVPWIHDWQRVSGGVVVDHSNFREPMSGHGRVTMVQADIGDLLPVYCLDRYEGFEVVKRFIDLDDSELQSYIDRNRQAISHVVKTFSPDAVLINHVVMGPEALRPVLQEAGIPYVVKVHGSELEYAIAEDDRFVAPGQSALAGAASILAGSAHIATRTRELLGHECCGDRIELVPPGVDMELFVPATDRHEVQACLLQLVRDREGVSAGRSIAAEVALQSALAGDPAELLGLIDAIHGTYQERDIEHGVAARLAQINPADEPAVAFVGKAIRQKGAQLLFAAWPLVRQCCPRAKLIVTGFGLMREGWQAIVEALSSGDRDMLGWLIARGSALDGGPHEPLHQLVPFFLALDARGETDEYFAAARGMRDSIVFTGQVDHAVLSKLWPLCRASVVPSIFPEAFGMVSAEAAACGCLPVVADHTGLADVARALRADYPEWARGFLGFQPTSATAISDLAEILANILELDLYRHSELAAIARSVVGREWCWGTIADRIEQSFHLVAKELANQSGLALQIDAGAHTPVKPRAPLLTAG
jgi:glycosyltransferase involved in cell wall biosynthesis